MLRSTAGTAAALSLALLLMGGCSRDSDDNDPAAAGPASVSAGDPVPGASSSPDSLSSPGAPGSARPAPGTSDAAVEPDAPREIPDNAVESTVAPTQPSGRKLPQSRRAAAGWVNAKVTRGGDGPCYGVTTDDGKAYAVYAEDAASLAKGTRIRARLTPGRTPVNCGSGTPATVVRLLVQD